MLLSKQLPDACCRGHRKVTAFVRVPAGVGTGLILGALALGCQTSAESTAGEPAAADSGRAPAAETPPAKQDAQGQLASRRDEIRPEVTESADVPPAERPPAPSGTLTLAELQAQLEAAGAKPAAQVSGVAQIPDATTLLQEAKRTATQLTEKIAAGDLGGAIGLTASSEEIRECVAPGLLSVLQGPVTARNESTLRSLVQAIGGRQITLKWTPGPLYGSKERGIFRPGTVVLQNGELRLDADGVQITVVLEQMIWQGNGWTIFSIVTP